jgi:hypothetical protein
MSKYIVTAYSEEDIFNSLMLKKSGLLPDGDAILRQDGFGQSADQQEYQEDEHEEEESEEEESEEEDSDKNKPDEEGAGNHHHERSFIESYFEEEEPSVDDVGVFHEHHEGLHHADGMSVETIEGDAEEVLKEIGKKIPGVEVLIVEEEEEEEEKETDWEHDKDPKHFMAYISKAYPAGIPKHDGTSTLGCERAIHHLKDINKQISEALRMDTEDLLDLKQLENIRIGIIDDIDTLNNHMNYLKEQRRKKKKAFDESLEIVKEASTATIQLVMTPFERAISGIITNAVISAGKPFEDVYEFLKEKYSLNEREELAIFQILKDMGHPIFKDRGTLGKSKEKDGKGQSVEFIKNYFA